MQNIKNKPLVSVLMPVYNCENYVEDALKSIINQSYKNIEIIVVDDGSTDNTNRILKKLANLDNRIKIIEQKKRRDCISLKHRFTKFKGNI